MYPVAEKRASRKPSWRFCRLPETEFPRVRASRKISSEVPNGDRDPQNRVPVSRPGAAVLGVLVDL
jgi:hypothetical protein